MTGLTILYVQPDDGTAEAWGPGESRLKYRHCATDNHGSVAGLLAEMALPAQVRAVALGEQGGTRRGGAMGSGDELAERPHPVRAGAPYQTHALLGALGRRAVDILREHQRQAQLRLLPRGPNPSIVELSPGRPASRSGPLCKRAGDGGGTDSLRKTGGTRQASRTHQDSRGPARRRPSETARPRRPNILSADCITGARTRLKNRRPDPLDPLDPLSCL